jgi:peptidyl-prolyl cis-trans isomerase B (cyclophilin B)
MKRLVLVVPVMILLAGCGGGGTKEKAAAGCQFENPTELPMKKPKLVTLDSGKTYDIVVRTNKGNITIELATKTSPCTTASFVTLVQKGFFNGLIFHRIVPGFVIQGGDPNGNGTGTPGYLTIDKPPADTTYTKGVVAMAKAQGERPGTAGSQFFIVTGADAKLSPDFAILGKVVDGLDVVEKIGALGDANDPNGIPTERVEIKSMQVETS